MPLYNSPIYHPDAGDGLPREHNRFYPRSGPRSLLGDPYIGVPAGLEAVLEYNGLYMNVQRNIDRYRITSIDGLYDADIRDVRDVNPDHDGETPYSAFYSGRTITINGTIDTYTVPKLRAMQYGLKAAFADIRNEYPLYFRTGDFHRDHFIKCKKIGAISGTEQQQNALMQRDFQISLRASNPRFLSFYQRSHEFLLDVASPMTLDTIYHLGNYIAEPIFRVFGPFTSATFTDDDTGQYFALNGSVDSGDFIDYDNCFPTSVKNSTGQNMWSMLTDGSRHVYIKPEGTTIIYSGDAHRVQIYWRDSWI